jgi:hypothetical protein
MTENMYTVQCCIKAISTSVKIPPQLDDFLQDSLMVRKQPLTFGRGNRGGGGQCSFRVGRGRGSYVMETEG